MATRPSPYSIVLSAVIVLSVNESSDDDYENVLNKDDHDACLRLQVDHLLSTSAADSTRSVSDLLEDYGQRSSSGSMVLSSWLTAATRSLDALIDFMTECRRTILANCKDDTILSVSAAYVLSVCQSFEELSFEAVGALWKQLKEEIDAYQNNDDVLSRSSSRQFWKPSAEQLQERLAVEAKQLFKKSSSSDMTNLANLIQSVLETNPEWPMAHFCNFCYSLQTGEQETAVDALHHFVDSALVHGDSILPYAPILACYMHDAFGQRHATQQATQEAIRVAQQGQNAASVAFALGWLAIYHFHHQAGEEGGSGNNNHQLSTSPALLFQELIRRCMQRASASQLRSLAAGAHLTLAQRSMQWQNPASFFGAVAQASADDANDAHTGVNSWDRPTHMTHLRSGEEALTILARQRLVAAGLWDAVGQGPLSKLFSWMVLRCHADHLSNSDLSVAARNFARSCLFGYASPVAFEDLGVSAKNEHGTDADLDSSCVYSQALHVLITLRDIFNLPLDGGFLLDVHLILHEWAVRRGDLVHADALGNVLESLLSKRLHDYEEVVVDVMAQNALRLSRQGKWDDAKRLLLSLIAECKRAGNHTRRARLLLDLSALCLESCPHTFTAAIAHLLECLTVSKEHGLNGIHNAALSILAQVHLRMGNPKRAIATLKASLPTVQGSEHVWFQGQAYLTYAKCHLHLAKGETRRSEFLRHASKDLQRSERYFKQCDDTRRRQEIYYLQARVFDELNQVAARDEASSKFVALSRYLAEANKPMDDHTLHDVSNMSDLDKVFVNRGIVVP